MNLQIHPLTKACSQFKKSTFILLLVSSCFTSLLRGQTSNPLSTHDQVASIDLPDAYAPNRQMKKAGVASKEASVTKKTLVIHKAYNPKMKIEILPNSCTQKLRVSWEGTSSTAGFTLVNAEEKFIIPNININKGSRLEFDLPVGDYLILLQIRNERFTQKISVY